MNLVPLKLSYLSDKGTSGYDHKSSNSQNATYSEDKIMRIPNRNTIKRGCIKRKEMIQVQIGAAWICCLWIHKSIWRRWWAIKNGDDDKDYGTRIRWTLHLLSFLFLLHVLCWSDFDNNLKIHDHTRNFFFFN